MLLLKLLLLLLLLLCIKLTLQHIPEGVCLIQVSHFLTPISCTFKDGNLM